MARPYSLHVHKRGSGPDLVLFHGGMGCWKHWIRNIDALAGHFTVHALDHLAYGKSPGIAKETSAGDYLDLMHESVLDLLPGEATLRLAGFSFGGAIASHLAVRLSARVSHLCLVSPAGFPPRDYSSRPSRSYKKAGGDETLFREICRHNLLANMLSYPETITEETIDIQAYCVRNTRYDSRKVSLGGSLLPDLARINCRLRLLWGEGDDAEFRPADKLIGQIRETVGELDLHRIPHAGHWSLYENPAAVNELMIEFFTS